jgi:hypothetical protein
MSYLVQQRIRSDRYRLHGIAQPCSWLGGVPVLVQRGGVSSPWTRPHLSRGACLIGALGYAELDAAQARVATATMQVTKIGGIGRASASNRFST